VSGGRGGAAGERDIRGGRIAGAVVGKIESVGGAIELVEGAIEVLPVNPDVLVKVNPVATTSAVADPEPAASMLMRWSAAMTVLWSMVMFHPGGRLGPTWTAKAVPVAGAGRAGADVFDEVVSDGDIVHGDGVIVSLVVVSLSETPIPWPTFRMTLLVMDTLATTVHGESPPAPCVFFGLKTMPVPN